MQTGLGIELTQEVMATADVFLRESQRLFRPHGLTAAQYNVLNVLSDAADGLSQRELGDILVVDRSNVTGLIDRLEKGGLVKRAAHPSDRRAHRVSLTPAGRRLWTKVQPIYNEAAGQLVAGLGQRRLRDALAVLKALQAGAVAWRDGE